MTRNLNVRNHIFAFWTSGLALVLSLVAAPNPYGACAHVTRGEPADRTCEMLRAAGLGWVRSDFDWSALEVKPGEWNFAKLDRAVSECETRGVQLLPILGYSVPWAHPAHEHLDQWGTYVRKVVRRYGPRLPVLEVWNEENIQHFWKEPNPTNYLALLKRTYQEVKAENNKLQVAFGGTAGVPLAFIEEVYKLGGAKYFDLMNVHPYSHPRRPEGHLDAQIEQLRKVMAKYGDAKKPIWITELGWPTHQVQAKSADVPNEASQAKMMARALGISFAEGISKFFWYETTQSDVNPYDPESYFGMLRANFAPKPAYSAYATFVERRPPDSVQLPGMWRSANGRDYFPQWKLPDGRVTGMIWTIGQPGPRQLRFTTDKLEFMDHLGARVRPKRQGDAWFVEVNDSPIYFRGGELRRPIEEPKK